MTSTESVFFFNFIFYFVCSPEKVCVHLLKMGVIIIGNNVHRFLGGSKSEVKILVLSEKALERDPKQA